MGKIMCLKTCIMVRTISCNPGAPLIQSISMCVPMCACARVSMWLSEATRNHQVTNAYLPLLGSGPVIQAEEAAGSTRQG